MMPPYLTDIQIWQALWPLILLPLLSSFIFSLIFESIRSENYFSGYLFTIVFTFSLLGIVTGQITGISRVAAVGAVLPAVLSLIGGILVYLISNKSKEIQMLASVAVLGLVIHLLVGIYWGSNSRVVYESAVSDPNRLLANEILLERNRHEVALRRLKNDTQLLRLRKGLEDKYNIKITLPAEE